MGSSGVAGVPIGGPSARERRRPRAWRGAARGTPGAVRARSRTIDGTPDCRHVGDHVDEDAGQ